MNKPKKGIVHKMLIQRFFIQLFKAETKSQNVPNDFCEISSESKTRWQKSTKMDFKVFQELLNAPKNENLGKMSSLFFIHLRKAEINAQNVPIDCHGISLKTKRRWQISTKNRLQAIPGAAIYSKKNS